MTIRRIGVGRFWHESNSFSAVQAELDDFASYQDGILTGASVLECGERRDEITGVVDVLSRDDRVEKIPLVSAGALPSGPLSDDAVAGLEHVLRDSLQQAGELDGICFALHGAMSGASNPDLDGTMLRILRDAVGPNVPIVIALDCHAVVTQQMVDLADVLIAYRTHPHVDIVETGARAARILLDMLDGKIKPVTRFLKVPILFPPPDDGTHSGALKSLFDSVIAWDERESVVACSLCPSFAWQDVPEQGVTAIAVTDNEPAFAQRLAGELAEACWQARHDLVPEPMLSAQAAVREAAAVPGCPVVITDSADTVGGGAPGDNTAILEALLKTRAQVDGLMLCHIPDAQAVSQVAGTKIGETVTVSVGGKQDTRFCQPLSVTGRLLCLTDGQISDDANVTSEAMLDVGTVACLDVDNVRLVLTEKRVMGPQPSLFRKVGIEPFDAKIVVLKTGVGYRLTYAQVAKAVIRADCPGAQSYNLSNYEFTRIPRPMFPMDGNFDDMIQCPVDPG